MKRTIGTGWTVGFVALTVLGIGGVYWFTTRTGPVHARMAPSTGRPMPMQQFIPKATEP